MVLTKLLRRCREPPTKGRALLAPSAEEQDDEHPSVRFDHIAQFALAQPTLSVTTTAGETVVSDDGELRSALYCVQLAFIQQYLLDPALCQPSALGHAPFLCWASKSQA